MSGRLILEGVSRGTIGHGVLSRGLRSRRARRSVVAGALVAGSLVAHAPGSATAAPLVNPHVQVQGSPACRTYSASDLWRTYDLPTAPAGAFQIADAQNKEMFVAAADGKVYHDYVDPLTAPLSWSPLGGPASGIFGSVRDGTNYLGNQELYVRAKDGQVYHDYATPGQGSGWQGWDPMGQPAGGIRGDVIEGTNDQKNQELYVLGTDGNVYHKFATPGVGTGWSNWDTMSHPDGVTVTGDVQIGINYLCNQEIYVTGTNGNTYHKFATPGVGSGWSEWGSLGQPAAGVIGSVAAGENSANNQELFVIGADHQVYHDYSTPGQGTGWSGWGSLGAPPGGAITSTSLIVDTYPVEKLTITTSAGDFIDVATPGRGSGWSGWTNASTPPPLTGSFSDVRLPDSAANPLNSPTAIVSLDGSRALVLERGGEVRVLLGDGTLLDADALTLNVCTVSVEGLLGAAVDPQFASNGFVYLYYTANAGNCSANSGRFNRVSRFTMTGNSIDPASEVVLLDNLSIRKGNHDGGDLHVGHDGYLYVTIGDDGTNPRGGSASAAQDLSLLNGKIVRITTSGGSPPDNPFVGAPDAVSCATAGVSAPANKKCTEIYAYGLRNPFRFAFDPNTSATRFYINDVGENTWEEVDEGGNGLNYGWDLREGFCNNGSYTICPPTPAGLTDPLTAYNHRSGCTFITAAAFVPNGIWPADYDGSYLFGDGGCGKIFRLTSAGAVDYANPFAVTTGVITDMAFLTQGGLTALYYVTNSSNQIHMIYFHP